MLVVSIASLATSDCLLIDFLCGGTGLLVAGTGAPVSDSSSFSISLAFTASAAISSVRFEGVGCC